MRKMLLLLGFPDNRIIMEDKATAPSKTLSSQCRSRNKPELRASSCDLHDASGAS